MSVKFYCDRCGNETQFQRRAEVTVDVTTGLSAYQNPHGVRKDLCEWCLEQLKDFFNALPRAKAEG